MLKIEDTLKKFIAKKSAIRNNPIPRRTATENCVIPTEKIVVLTSSNLLQLRIKDFGDILPIGQTFI